VTIERIPCFLIKLRIRVENDERASSTGTKNNSYSRQQVVPAFETVGTPWIARNRVPKQTRIVIYCQIDSGAGRTTIILQQSCASQELFVVASPLYNGPDDWHHFLRGVTTCGICVVKSQIISNMAAFDPESESGFSTSPLLRLPFEIRLMIYEYLLHPSEQPSTGSGASLANLLPDFHTYYSEDTNNDAFTLSVRTIDPWLGSQGPRTWRRRGTYHVRTGK
jgi:hypothetical protein